MPTPDAQGGPLNAGNRFWRWAQDPAPAAPPPATSPGAGRDYSLYLVRFVTPNPSPYSPEPGKGRLVRMYRGDGRGWRPVVFWTRTKAEEWLDGHCLPLWREFLEVARVSRAEWERLVVAEGLLPTGSESEADRRAS